MVSSSTMKRILYFVLKYIIIGLIISGSVLLICYFIKRTSSRFMSNVLTYVGGAIITTGVYGIFGTQKTIGNLYYYQNVRTVQSNDSSTRLNQDFQLINGAYSFTIKALIVSSVPFVLSIIMF